MRGRAVRLALETAGQHASRWQAAMSIAAKIGCAAHTRNAWVMKAEVDAQTSPPRRPKGREGFDIARCTVARVMKDRPQ